MSGFLGSMAERSRERAVTARGVRSAEQIEASINSCPPPLTPGGFGRSFDVIAEIKPRSPAEGDMPERPPAASALSYRRGGAAVISVLTEPSAFGGSLAHLRSVRAAVDVPVMAKDFLVDPYQVLEAREAGADGVLLIARILSDEALKEMLATASGLGMFTLLEAFDQGDLERVTEHADGREGAAIGVNCRDLDTLDVVPDRHRDLARHLPTGVVAVAESGIGSPDDIERVAALGYGAALVGSALMRSEDAEGTVRSMIAAGRRVAVAP